MQNLRSAHRLALIILISIATVAGLSAAYQRFHVEESNRRVEIALEWQEVTLLAQTSGHPIAEILRQFKEQEVSTLVLSEDTIAGLEQAGLIRSMRVTNPAGPPTTVIQVDSKITLDRIAGALKLRRLPILLANAPADGARTRFELVQPDKTASLASPKPEAAPREIVSTPVDYLTLRTLGVGLPPEALDVARLSGLRIAGRIANFPGVNEETARADLENLFRQGASTVIFNGDEVLGYRGLEKNVARIFEGATTSTGNTGIAKGETPVNIPVYGAVEFSKQKGDEKLAAALRGAYVRVHSIQSAEMGQMEEDEAVDRFIRAAKERNIRFCYVRLVTFAGQDPVAENLRFLMKIARGMAHGSRLTGGDMRFGPAHLYADTGVPSLLFGLAGLGAAAGAIWMLRALGPFPLRFQTPLLVVLSIVCFLTAALLGETGRKLVAFLAGVIYPTIACLVTFPTLYDRDRRIPALRPMESLARATRTLIRASLITALGIIQVVGLLATRPFMLRANQFLGIKAQHAVPLLIVALVAIAGGVAASGENWERFRARVDCKLRSAMAEPARFGILLLGLVAIVGLALVVARTGNDAGVGVSGVELKVRTLLDRILPVRPRTKEFLVGHPAYILALAWWWRGRRRIAIPAFVVGSLGQVSLLNTFCHIHTPLIVSLWRDSLGLLFGILIGAGLFLLLEKILPAPGTGAVDSTPGNKRPRKAG